MTSNNDIDFRKDFWIYEPTTDAPRLATFEDFEAMKNRVVALTMHLWLLREISAHQPGEADEHLQWVRTMRATLQKDGLI